MLDSSLPVPPTLRRCVVRLGIPQVGIDWQLFDQALTHASSSSDANNERLEFLGDAVLRLAAAEFLMERYPDAKVGELTALRSHLTSDQILTEIAERLELESFLHVSAAALGDPTARPKRLADAVEAILSALYLSRGNLQLVRAWLDPHLSAFVEAFRQSPEVHNPKTALQELVQKHYKTLPEYRTAETSQAHASPEKFRAEVWFGDRSLGTGVGASRKAAEQAAARQAYAVMQAIVAETETPQD